MKTVYVLAHCHSVPYIEKKYIYIYIYILSTRLRPSRHRAWTSDQQTAKSQEKAQQEANKKLTKITESLENIRKYGGKFIPKSSQNHLKIIPKTFQNHSRNIPQTSPNHSKTFQKHPQTCLNHPQNNLETSQTRPKIM